LPIKTAASLLEIAAPETGEVYEEDEEGDTE
jgi:hypothetical protein